MNLIEIQRVMNPFHIGQLENLTPRSEHSWLENFAQVRERYREQKAEEEKVIQQIKDLITTDVEKARKITSRAIKQFPFSHIIESYSKVLEPPRVTTRPASGVSRKKEFRWINEHRGKDEFKGQWVALYQDKCLAVGVNLAEVRNKAKEQTDLKNVLIAYLSK